MRIVEHKLIIIKTEKIFWCKSRIWPTSQMNFSTVTCDLLVFSQSISKSTGIWFKGDVVDVTVTLLGISAC